MGKQMVWKKPVTFLKKPAASIFKKCVNAEDGSFMFQKMCETSLKIYTVLQLRKVYTVYKLLWKPQILFKQQDVCETIQIRTECSDHMICSLAPNKYFTICPLRGKKKLNESKKFTFT
jgi:hypothetical protein